MYVAAFFQVADSMQVCLSGVLRGVGDVSVPFMLTTISYWVIGLPLGYVLSGMPLPFGVVLPATYGVVGWWIALTVGLFLATFLLATRTHKMLWGKKGPVEQLEVAASQV